MKERILASAATLLLLAPMAIADTPLNPTPKIAIPTVMTVGENPGALDVRFATPTPGPKAYEALVASGSFLATGSTSPVDNKPYIEYGDDCHMSYTGPLTEFSMGYFKPGTGTCSAVITFYTNNATNTVLGPVVAGPYLVSGLPAGFVVVNITPPDSPLIPEHVWFAVQFQPNTAGLVIAGAPPTIGSSADIFVDTGLSPPAGLVNFGGSPVGNFMISVSLDQPVPVNVSTWGNVKALYRTEK